MSILSASATPVRPKKQFGQNFLYDQIVLTKIGQLVGTYITQYQYPILEIGPGTGQLTRILVQLVRDGAMKVVDDQTDIMATTPTSTTMRSITALEIDTEALEYLRTQSDLEHVDFVQQDALKLTQQSDSIFSKPYILVSNLPFNVGSRILVNLGIHNPIGNPFIVILQKEVVQKALYGGHFTLFGAWLNIFWQCQSAFDIPRTSYIPAPDVATSVMVGRPRVDIDELFEEYTIRIKAFALLKAMTSHPRKTVWVNLRYAGYMPVILDQIFTEYSWQRDLRLSWDNYIQVVVLLLKFDQKIATVEHSS